MTRSDSSPLVDFDPEIERTLRATRRRLFANNPTNQELLNRSQLLNSEFESLHSDFISSILDSDSISVSSTHSDSKIIMAQRERTLRELAAPDFTYESLCIQYPNEDVPDELKTGLIHLLP
ncbi:hypothetical protein Fmac_033016 [Flemingia macrophylla]|uniref:Uncharacterized protein n=1 Tax=Flemingia macrophylla TaxID=520843 RepID=A0ABD1L6K6_9FABA